MQGESSINFLFGAEIGRTLRVNRKEARLQKVGEKIGTSHQTSNTETTEEEQEIIMVKPQPAAKIFLADYEGGNAQGSRMTIVDQQVNVTHFQVNLTMLH